MRTVTKLIFATACLALLTFGFFAVDSDDSYAATSGTVKDQTSADVGTYDFVGYTLTITATSTCPATSITLVDFDRQADVEVIVLNKFVNDLTGSFDCSSTGPYENVRSILYRGNIADSSGGTWEFEIYSSESP
ncbi:MAG: hypothetical protein J6Y18_05430, partial [Candidatus Methanomethylophilaceae archaeon]|nr:hypothetical protein [Candidatus Methanomethylophilaceae archaeon]